MTQSNPQSDLQTPSQKTHYGVLGGCWAVVFIVAIVVIA